MSDIRSGIKTTEFWLALAAVIIGALLAAGVFPANHIAAKLLGAVAAVLAQLGYTWSRTKVKAAVGNGAARKLATKLELEARRKPDPGGAVNADGDG